VKRVAFLLLVVLCASFAVAQDGSKASVFGGYQYNNLGITNGIDRQTLHGWNFDAAANLKKNFSLVGDVGGAYKSVDVLGVTAKMRVHSFMFGPRVNAPMGKVTPFAQAVFGVAHISGEALGQGDSTNKFGMAFGGGVDYDVNKSVAIRLGKVDYFVIRVGEGLDNMNAFRYSTGVVFKF
jgi:opacity protein-like surface antigen